MKKDADYKVGDLIYDANIYDGLFHSVQNLDMRMYFPQELDTYLKWNGFTIIHKFGGFDEECFNNDSEKQIFVCKLDK